MPFAVEQVLKIGPCHRVDGNLNLSRVPTPESCGRPDRTGPGPSGTHGAESPTGVRQRVPLPGHGFRINQESEYAWLLGLLLSCWRDVFRFQPLRYRMRHIAALSCLSHGSILLGCDGSEGQSLGECGDVPIQTLLRLKILLWTHSDLDKLDAFECADWSFMPFLDRVASNEES